MAESTHRRELHTAASEFPHRILCWAHFGDLHLTTPAAQNYRDLLALVSYTNRVLAQDLQFVFLPGDIADDGSEDEYQLAAAVLRPLLPPLRAIAGDHDFTSGNLHHLRTHLAPEPFYAHTVGAYRLVFANAMEGPRREVFRLSPEQLAWLAQEFAHADQASRRIVLFVHCYPSDFHEGGAELAKLIRQYRVLLVEMGHTHYNELANDGTTIYAATRSTGQIEEGLVGFSLTALDDGVVSWRFYELEALQREDAPVALITSPADRLLIRDPHAPQQVITGDCAVRAKCWSTAPIRTAIARIAGLPNLPLTFHDRLGVWAAQLSPGTLQDGTHPLTVVFTDGRGREASDTIHFQIARAHMYQPPARAPRDQDNAVGAYPEKGILGTQLGPNKNGRKW